MIDTMSSVHGRIRRYLMSKGFGNTEIKRMLKGSSQDALLALDRIAQRLNRIREMKGRNPHD